MDPEENLDLSRLEQAVRADIDRERGLGAWLRSGSRALRFALALAFGVGVALLTLVAYARRDLDTYPLARMCVTLGWFGVAAGVSAWLALRPIYLPRPDARLVAAVAVFALLGPVVTALWPAAPAASGLALGHAYSCFIIGTSVGLAALLFARALDRGGAHGVGQMVLAAVAAGLVGTVALQVHCPNNYPMHLLLGHATVPVGLVAGTLLARRFGKR